MRICVEKAAQTLFNLFCSIATNPLHHVSAPAKITVTVARNNVKKVAAVEFGPKYAAVAGAGSLHTRCSNSMLIPFFILFQHLQVFLVVNQFYLKSVKKCVLYQCCCKYMCYLLNND